MKKSNKLTEYVAPVANAFSVSLENPILGASGSGKDPVPGTLSSGEWSHSTDWSKNEN